ncbi:MAG: hypothetical protein F6K30_17830 [Cyanothece sp. SIO2G6]|nr:hypothetical protein [Cyanothece sp. SIO2G6]
MAESLYEWLAHSDFAQVGRSKLIAIQVDGDPVDLPLIALTRTTRSLFIALFNEMVLSETSAMLDDLDHNVAQELLTSRTYRLKKLMELLNCTKNENFSYLQRE